MEGKGEGEECEEEEEEEVKDSSENIAVEMSCQSLQELMLAEKEVLKEEPVEDKEGENIDEEEGDSRSPQGEMSLTLSHDIFIGVLTCLSVSLQSRWMSYCCSVSSMHLRLKLRSQSFHY